MDEPLMHDWEKVRLTVTYYTGSSTRRTSHEISKDDLEKDYRNTLTARLNAVEMTDEEKEEAIERIASFQLSHEEFMDQVFSAAETLATSPIQTAGPSAHSVRVLPPWAIRSVDIEVIEPALSGLVLPN